MEPDDLLCSRNARPEKVLVGRAQWKINQPPSLKRYKRGWRDHLEGPFGESLAPILGEFMDQDMPVGILSS